MKKNLSRESFTQNHKFGQLFKINWMELGREKFCPVNHLSKKFTNSDNCSKLMDEIGAGKNLSRESFTQNHKFGQLFKINWMELGREKSVP